MLKYNNNYVYNASYNGNTLNTIVYNGVTVWKAPFCNANWGSYREQEGSSTVQVSLEYNVPLTITSNQSWCTVSGDYGESSLNGATSYYVKKTLYLNIAANTGVARSATVTVKYGSTTFGTIVIEQDAGESWSVASYTLNVSVTNVNLIYRAIQEGVSYRDTAIFSVTSYRTLRSNLGNTKNEWVTPQYSFSTDWFDGISYSGSGITRTANVDIWVSSRSQSGFVTLSLSGTSKTVYIKVV